MNRRLTGLLKKWQIEGSQPQDSFDWSSSRPNWVKAFPAHEGFIARLPSAIGREDVIKICQGKKHSVIEKFLSVMIWGYGDRGYGPYRVSKMLSQPHAESVLQAAYDLCQASKPKEAYQYLTQNRIRNLGPAFGTKYLAFCTPREVGAPILDSFVGLWLKEFADKDFEGVGLNYLNWNLKTYSRYWDWVKEHAESFSCNPDDVELVIFRNAEEVFSSSSKWASK